MGEFEAFWNEFPRKVGKLAAQAAYQKARRMATAEELLEGVKRYIQSKPAYADWCHAKTWLGQGRWLDRPDTVSAQPERPFTADELRQARDWKRAILGCPHREPCASRDQCMAKFIRHTLRLEAE